MTRPVLAELRLGDFRCFEAASVEPGPDFNVFAGGNATGKSSLLEGIYFLGRGKSFRAARAETAIRFDAERCSLFARLDEAERSRLGLEVSRSEGLVLKVDGEAATRAALARALPVQLLDPSSHELVSGAPAGRREFLDWGVFHVEPSFLPAWQRYRRALQQRNAALRSTGRGAWAWDDILAAEGQVLDRVRRETVERIVPRLQSAGMELLGADIEVTYQSGWAQGLELEAALADARERDTAMGSSTVGPHRADLRISLRARRARETASRGQEKLVAAALTLAQANLVAEALGRRIVLLVDEPGADLDRTHLAALLEHIATAPVQTFLTSLETTALPIPPDSRVFHVEHGAVRALL